MGLPASWYTDPTRPFAPAALKGKEAGIDVIDHDEGTGEGDAGAEPTRKGSTAIRVYCTPAEHAALTEAAEQTGLSVSTYLRRIGIGYQPRSMIDLERVEALLKVSADLGRMGGLLKMWLTDDARLSGYWSRDMRSEVNRTLAGVEEAQAEIKTIAKTVLRARA